MFERPHHRRVLGLLKRLDGDLLKDCRCGFAGGSAVAMQLEEYRRSDDIDLLCASADGYRHLRERVFDRGLAGLARKSLSILRPARTDQYGIRGVLGDSDAPVKFEIVREARITLTLARERLGGVPLVCRSDLYAEKLLANADRGLDGSTLHRDIIDLAMMRHCWGPVPVAALKKSRGAYGGTIDRALADVAGLLLQDERLSRSLKELDAKPGIGEILQPILARWRQGSP